MKKPLIIADYPLAETRSAEVRGKRGKSLDDITLEAVLSGDVEMEDLRITPQALADQAEIARAAGRPTLALNFERAAELVEVPQDLIMSAYELLRPGRARSKAELLAMAATFRQDYGAAKMAAFIEEAAAVYERRGLYAYRF
jgi:propanediol dehydratase small subunit